ncbi:hypothetical protein GCM10028807_60460 [Spirosoma daeguense]
MGIVHDYVSHRPLKAQLFVETQRGRFNLGMSADETGRFSIEITCPVKAIIVEKDGYRSQKLLLNVGSTSTDKPIGVVIPLVANDQPGFNKPYSQTEQTHFVQKNNNEASIRPQHNTFTIRDALTNQFLEAKICLFYTKTDAKNCFDTNKAGQFKIDFTEKDIVAIEIDAPGYATYKGIQVVEQGDSRQFKHDVRLTRALTLFSLQIDATTGSCELRPEDPKSKPINLRPIPGLSRTLVAYDLLPQAYTLVITDQQNALREQRSIQIQPGLNFASSSATVNASATPSDTPMSRPDSALRFTQGSYDLLPDSQTLLSQMATYLIQNNDINVRVMGHTDKEGNETLNKNLSELRAKVVASFLERRGVADNRITIEGLGSSYPIAPSDTEENKAKNRRVVIKFLSK